MKLTGKCKEDFEKWLVCGEGRVNFYKYYSDKHGDDDPYLWFTELPTSMQYGVYVDFFDSVDLSISMNQSNKTYWYDIQETLDDCKEVKTRPLARTQAIEKANEIYNK